MKMFKRWMLPVQTLSQYQNYLVIWSQYTKAKLTFSLPI